MPIALKPCSLLQASHPKPLKIAIVVHGRFYAFDLARELINQGHAVTLFTNYPKSVVEQFGIPPAYVHNFLVHGLASRLLRHLHNAAKFLDFEPWLHQWFSRWAAQEILRNEFDVVHVFSGVAEEILQASSETLPCKIVVRGSSHIRTQFQLLLEEEHRANTSIEKPSEWIIQREENEYQLADTICVLSAFAKQSFEQKVDQQKLRLLPLGTQLNKFRPDINVIQERCQRILSNSPLRVLMVGSFSYRKGAIDLAKIAMQCSPQSTFKFVGDIVPEARLLAKQSKSVIEFIPRQPQHDLPQYYAWADLFIFTTIEDGFPVVLTQAQAAGLPMITTSNCSGPDLIQEGQTGWIVPIRQPEEFIARLQWCHTHRQELVQMVHQVYDNFIPRDWSDVATDFVEICNDLIQQKTQPS